MKYTTKSMILNIFDYLPSQAFYLLTKHVLKSGGVNFSEGIPEVWRFVEESVQNIGAKTLVEFGAGKNLGLNLLLSRSVNAQTVVDLDAMLDVRFWIGSKNFQRNTATRNCFFTTFYKFY